MNEQKNTFEDAMIVEEPGHEESNAIGAQELLDGLTGGEPEKPEAAAQEKPAQENSAAKGGDARLDEVKNGIAALSEDGWTKDDFDAFMQDGQVRADIAAGEDFMRVAAAFERRKNAAQAAPSVPAAKKGVPTVRNASTAGVRDSSMIENMTDKEFAEFSRRAQAALMSGKLVTIR